MVLSKGGISLRDIDEMTAQELTLWSIALGTVHGHEFNWHSMEFLPLKDPS